VYVKEFALPVMLSVNAVLPRNSVAPLIAKVTKTFNILHRASWNNNRRTGDAFEAWWSGVRYACFPGKFTNSGSGSTVSSGCREVKATP
jgi:hypothetical protein